LKVVFSASSYVKSLGFRLLRKTGSDGQALIQIPWRFGEEIANVGETWGSGGCDLTGIQPLPAAEPFATG